MPPSLFLPNPNKTPPKPKLPQPSLPTKSPAATPTKPDAPAPVVPPVKSPTTLAPVSPTPAQREGQKEAPKTETPPESTDVTPSPSTETGPAEKTKKDEPEAMEVDGAEKDPPAGQEEEEPAVKAEPDKKPAPVPAPAPAKPEPDKVPAPLPANLPPPPSSAPPPRDPELVAAPGPPLNSREAYPDPGATKSLIPGSKAAAINVGPARAPIQRESESSLPIIGADEEYIANHKDIVNSIRYSRRGDQIATASEDTSIKILDCEKMRLGGNSNRMLRGSQSIKPVLRSFYDHVQGINDIDWHPNDKILVSAGTDRKLYFWDMTRGYKRSSAEITETMPMQSVHIHPGGEYMIAGGDADFLRLYNMETFQGFISNDKSPHLKPVNQVRWSAEGNIFVSAATDGFIKVWDGTSMRCVNTIRNAHGGLGVVNVEFTSNTKYLLSTGMDGKIAMWDMSTGREVMQYKFDTPSDYKRGGRNPNPMQRAIGCFSYHDQMVLGCRELDDHVYAWEAATGRRIFSKFIGHRIGPASLAGARSGVGFCIGGRDKRARYWVCHTKDSALTAD